MPMFGSDNAWFGKEPPNFETIKAVRSRTWFGSGAHCRCTANNRRTGLQCKNAAVKGERTCRFHGGTAARNRRNNTLGKGCTPQTQYPASLLFSKDLNSHLKNVDPSMVALAMRADGIGARGRKLHDLINGRPIKDD